MNKVRKNCMQRVISIILFVLVLTLHASAHGAVPGCTAKDVPISRLELVEILQRDDFSRPLRGSLTSNDSGRYQWGNPALSFSCTQRNPDRRQGLKLI